MSYKSFTALIQQYFQRNGGWIRIKGELAVYFWPRIAGPDLAKKAVVQRYQDGSLYLQTDSPALAHQITLMSQDIIKRCDRIVGRGVIKSIRVRIGVISAQPESAIPAKIADLEPAQQQLIEECRDEISDPDLREKFAGAMIRSLRLSKEKQAIHHGYCGLCGVVTESGYDRCPCCQFKSNPAGSLKEE